ncbi:MAG: PaaI family thioesterase [Acidimicrobiales bacterium]
MSHWSPPRPTFDDYDPAVAEAMPSLTSMGGIPDYLGISITHVGPGTMTAELEVRPELLNPFGSAHGGTLAALVDHVLGAVLYPLIPRGAWAATTEFKLNLLAPVREGVLRARSEVIALTRRTAVVHVEAVNGGRLVGVAQGTVTISLPKPDSAP